MQQKKQDKLLTLIDKGYQVTPIEENREYLNELEQQGLIREEGENSYNLTRYGEMIKVMGFQVHEETERFEQKLSGYTPDKRRKTTAILMVAFSFLILFLILLLLTDLDEWVLNLALHLI